MSSSPFWLLVFGLITIWFITSGRAQKLIDALSYNGASVGSRAGSIQ